MTKYFLQTRYLFELNDHIIEIAAKKIIIVELLHCGIENRDRDGSCKGRCRIEVLEGNPIHIIVCNIWIDIFPQYLRESDNIRTGFVNGVISNKALLTPI